MLPVAEARTRILAAFSPQPTEWIPLGAALGRVLSAPLLARRDQPPAAVSAMDGYAVHAADTDPPGRWLSVIGEVPAGHRLGTPLRPGEAARIFTGAPLPEGADAIAIQENAEVLDNRVRFSRACTPGEFVRPAGLDFAIGWEGLAAGTVLDSRALGLAAAMGHAWLPVRLRPRIGILATGDELAWPGETAGPDRIISSNSTALAGMITGWGGEPVDLGIAKDRPDELTAHLREARGLDALLTSGGASVGDYDLVQQALGTEGLELGFWKIAMRPGKPLLFGTLAGTPILGLPGNPVSSAVCAIIFLRPAMRNMLGLPPDLPERRLPLEQPLPANDVREDYMRASYVAHADGHRSVLAARRQDSSMFATFARADALIVRPPRAPALAVGEPVSVIDLAEALRT
ncbi:MAG: gephyrin-like molybdotransferase Glp [Geminicoccaceae bacterium]